MSCLKKCWPADDVGSFPEDSDEAKDFELSDADIEKVKEACYECREPVCK